MLDPSRKFNLENLLERFQLEAAVQRIIAQVLPDEAHNHPKQDDAAESADKSRQALDALEDKLRDYLGIFEAGDLFSNVNKILRRDNWERVVTDLILSCIDEQDPTQTMTLLESGGDITRMADEMVTRIKTSLYGKLDATYAFDRDVSKPTLTGITQQRDLFKRSGLLGTDHFPTLDRAQTVQEALHREVGIRGGLVTGNAGFNVLDAILDARRTISIGMFQSEHPVILQALATKQQELSLKQGKVELMLTPPKTDRGISGVGFMNTVTRTVLGSSSVQFDPDVMGSGGDDPEYAHYKFLGFDLEEDLQKRRVIIGSFNLTRGALGQILDSNSQVSRRNSNNFEMGFDISYGMVLHHGLERKAFARITEEAQDYASWLFDRAGRNRLDPVGSVRAQRDPNSTTNKPQHILSGPQTHEQIRRSLGLDSSDPRSRMGKFAAYMALNVVTKGGVDKIYSDIEASLRLNSENTMTLFVSKGFMGLRTDNYGREDFDGSTVQAKLNQLEKSFGPRFKVVETTQYIHAKSLIVMRELSGSVFTDVIAGSPNVSEYGIGGRAQDVSLFLSSQNFQARNDKGPDYLTEQAMNIVRHLWSISPRPFMGAPLSAGASASADRLLSELKKRLNPSLERLTSIRSTTEPGILAGQDHEIGSLVSLGVRVRHNNTDVTAINDLFRFRVEDFGDGRVYLPELQKVIDPVLASRQGVTLDMGTGRQRGKSRDLTMREFSSSEVVAAAIEQITVELEAAAKIMVHDYARVVGGETSRLQEFMKPGGQARRALARLAQQRFSEAFAHFEGMPLGERATDARQFRRLVFGVEHKDLNQVRDRSLKAHMMALHKAWGGVGNSMALLSLDASRRPMMSPESIDASLYSDDWQVLGELRSEANSPNRILKVVDGKPQVSDFHYTVMSDSLAHDKPAMLFDMAGFNLLNMTDMDQNGPNGPNMTAMLAASKPDQMAQRFKNALGADNAQLYIPQDSVASRYLETMNRPLLGKNELGLKEGVALNTMIVFGLSESALLNADVFRGTRTIRTPEPMRFKVKATDVINDPSTPGSAEMFDGRLKLGMDGEWYHHGPNGVQGQLSTANPLVITDMERVVRVFQRWQGANLQSETLTNPIFGHQGGQLVITDIKQVKGRDSGTIEYQLHYTIQEATGTSMRILSQGLKSVLVGTSGETFETFTSSLDDGFRKADPYAHQAFSALKMTDSQGKLDSRRVHMLAGENIIKSGVAWLQTGVFLLRDAAWRESFKSIFDTTDSVAEHETMMVKMARDTHKQTDALKKRLKLIDEPEKAGWLQNLFKIQGLSEVLSPQGMISNAMSKLSSDGSKRQRYLEIMDEIESKGENFVAQTIDEKRVVQMAVAYHAKQFATMSNNMRETFMDMSKNFGGVNKDGQHNIMMLGAVPLRFVDNVSAAAFPMSDRGTANFISGYTGSHSEKILEALSKSSEVQTRARQFSEILSVGYLAGGAVSMARASVKKGEDGTKFTDIALDRTNTMVMGIHFNPLAYTYAGMDRQAEDHLLEINEIVRKISGIDSGSDMDQKTLAEHKEKAMRLISQVRDGRGSLLSHNTDAINPSASIGDEYFRIFTLMEKANIGAPTIRLPMFQFRDEGGGTRVTGVDYMQMSMLSPATYRQLQSYEGFLGPMLKAQAQIEREAPGAISNLVAQMSRSGGLITHEVREQYQDIVAKVMDLQQKIRDAATTDIQKAVALMPARGMAMIANTIPGFDGLVIDEKTGTTIEDVVVLGDEAMMALTDDAMTAIHQTRAHVNQFLNDKYYSSKGRSTGIGGKTLVRRDVSDHTNELSLPDYILNSTDHSVKAVADSITKSFGELKQATLERRQAMTKTLTQVELEAEIHKHDQQHENNFRIMADVMGIKSDKFYLLSSKAQERYQRLTRTNAVRDRLRARIGNEGLSFSEKTPELARAQEYENFVKGNLEIFALKAQNVALHTLTRYQFSSGMDPIAKKKLNDALEIGQSKLDVLGASQEDREKLQRQLSQLDTDISKLDQGHDRLNKTKLRNLIESQIRSLDFGRERNTGQMMSGVSDEGLIHALEAMGVNFKKRVDRALTNQSLQSETGMELAIKSVTDMFSTKALLETIQDAQFAREDLAVALTRAGSPMGPGGVIGLQAVSIHQVNQALARTKGSFQIDAQMSRRSMFLHAAGMSIFLGDFDGDNAIIGTIKRYTTLKTVQKMMASHGGLAALGERASEWVKGTVLEGVALQDYQLYAGSLEKEFLTLKSQIQGGAREAAIDHAEKFVGAIGIVDKFAAELSNGDWDGMDTDTRNLYRTKAAQKINHFAYDMFGEIENTTRDLITQHLKGTEVSYEGDEIPMDSFEKVIKSNKFKNAAFKVYGEKIDALALVGKAMAGAIDPIKTDPTTVLRYAIKTAFASTKVIGNYTNIQSMTENFNQYSRMQTYDNYQKLMHQAKSLKSGESREFVAELEQKLKDFQGEHEKMADVIHGRVSGFMQALQQATRDAIKLKDTTEKGVGLGSVLQELMEDPVMKAINKTNMLMRGRSILDGESLPDVFNQKTDAYEQAFAHLNLDDAIKVTKDGRVEMDEKLTQTRAYTEFIGPMVEAANVVSEAAFKVKSQMIMGTERAQMKDEFNTEFDIRGSALLTAKSFIESHVQYRQLDKYRQGLKKSEAEWGGIKAGMDDHLKLMFLKEELRGGRIRDKQSMQRVLDDVMETFVAGHANLDYLETTARRLDPTGHFFSTLQYAASGYMAGQNQGDYLWKRLDRTDETHYKALFDIQRSLAAAVGINPLADVDSTDARNRNVNTLLKARDMSKEGQVHQTGPGAVLDSHAHGLTMLLIPIMGISAGVFLNTQQASAAVIGLQPKQQQSQRGMLGRLGDYLIETAVAWNPKLAIKQIDNIQGISDRQKWTDKLIFASSMMAGHLASKAVGRIMSGMEEETPHKLERGAGVLSMVSMMFASHALSAFTHPIFERENRRPDYQMKSSVVDDSEAMTDALLQDIEMYQAEAGQATEPPAVIVDEDGNPIPSDYAVTQNDLDSGISTPDNDPILAGTNDEVMPMDAYSRPNAGNTPTIEGEMPIRREERVAQAAEETRMYRK